MKDSNRNDWERPATGAAAVTPNDSADLAVKPARALWIGGAGNLAVTMADGSAVIFSGIPAGTLLPIRVNRVKATNTTATTVLALY